MKKKTVIEINWIDKQFLIREKQFLFLFEFELFWTSLRIETNTNKKST